MESDKINKDDDNIESKDIHDKLKGCLFGHALGNAIGNPLKFTSKKSIARNLIEKDTFDFPLPNKYRFNHKKDSENHWTDGTDFFIISLKSLIKYKGKVKTKDIAKQLKL